MQPGPYIERVLMGTVNAWNGHPKSSNDRSRSKESSKSPDQPPLLLSEHCTVRAHAHTPWPFQDHLAFLSIIVANIYVRLSPMGPSNVKVGVSFFGIRVPSASIRVPSLYHPHTIRIPSAYHPHTIRVPSAYHYHPSTIRVPSAYKYIDFCWS